MYKVVKVASFIYNLVSLRRRPPFYINPASYIIYKYVILSIKFMHHHTMMKYCITLLNLSWKATRSKEEENLLWASVNDKVEQQQHQKLVIKAVARSNKTSGREAADVGFLIAASSSATYNTQHHINQMNNINTTLLLYFQIFLMGLL